MSAVIKHLLQWWERACGSNGDISNRLVGSLGLALICVVFLFLKHITRV